MDLKAVIGVFFYYLIMASVFHFGIASLGGSTISNLTPINTSVTNPPETTATEGISGFFNKVSETISSIGATLGFMFFGIGLPTDTPAFIQYLISGVLSLMSVIMSVIFINAVWGGGGSR
jgi:hypothetical protein